jgi:hypothetical protein
MEWTKETLSCLMKNSVFKWLLSSINKGTIKLFTIYRIRQNGSSYKSFQINVKSSYFVFGLFPLSFKISPALKKSVCSSFQELLLQLIGLLTLKHSAIFK